jgi:purine-binding chemotaxis protein CheW
MKREETTLLSERAAALREAFDQAFVAAPSGITASTQAFLAIEIGGDKYALRLSEITELVADKKAVPLPSQSPDLLGIASFRGTLVAVYDLRILLGYPAAGSSPRWLVRVAQDIPVGLAFDQLDGYLDLPPEVIAPATGTEPMRQYLPETLTADDGVRSVINIASVLETIKQREQTSNHHTG